MKPEWDVSDQSRHRSKWFWKFPSSYFGFPEQLPA